MRKIVRSVKEISDFGDNEYIVLYTNIPELMKILEDNKECLNITEYIKRGKIVGKEYYFNKKIRAGLERLIDKYD